MQECDDRLIVQPFRPAQLEIDDEIDILLPVRHGENLEPHAAHGDFEILENGGAGTRMDGDGRAHRVPLDQLLDATEAGEHGQHYECRSDALEVVPAAEGDADGSHDPDRGGARQAHDRPARVENRAGPDEADARDDLRRYAGRVRARRDCSGARPHHGEREVRVQYRADADQNVGSESRGLSAELALQADGATEQRGETELQHQIEAKDLDDALEHFTHGATPSWRGHPRSCVVPARARDSRNRAIDRARPRVRASTPPRARAAARAWR